MMMIHSFIHQYSALEAGLAGTRAQPCDRYDDYDDDDDNNNNNNNNGK